MTNPEGTIFLRRYDPPIERKDLAPSAPLRGLTFAVKDNIAVQGQPLTMGMLHPVEASATKSAGVVDRMLSQGASLIGSTNLDEACLTLYGENRHYGRIPNPNFPDLSPLGSSGGSAAAVASGTADFALGTDLGGSVRAPAAACGIVGFKMSPNLLSREGILFESSYLDALGLFDSTAAECRTILESLLPECRKRDEHWKPELIFLDDASLGDLEPEVRASYRDTQSTLGREFRHTQINAPTLVNSWMDPWRILSSLGIAQFVLDKKLKDIDLPPIGNAIVRFAQSISAEDRQNAEQAKETAAETFRELLNDDSFLVTPALSNIPKQSLSRNEIASFRINKFLVGANLCSLPAATIPLRSAGDRMSIQLIGGFQNDFSLIHALCSIELTLRERHII